MKAKFFYCKKCGNVVVKFVDSGVTPTCCGHDMVELKPNTSEGMFEKHIPEIECKQGHMVTIKVGSKEHPMEPGHHIAFIAIETLRGGQVRFLHPGDKPEAEFCVLDDKVVAAYAYCNVHSLWAKEVDSKLCKSTCSAK